MGRKPTPQPLVLADSNNSLMSCLADAQSTASEPSTQGASPADARGPPFTHQRSPFISRFAPKRPQTGKSTLASSSDDSSQQRRPSRPSRDGEIAAASSAPSLPAAMDRPSGSALQSSSRSAASESKKSSKTGFFHFKSHKPASQLPASTSQLHSEPREQIKSRGSDGAGVSSKRGESPSANDSLRKPAPAFPSRSEISLSSAGDQDAMPIPSPGKKSRSKSFALLGRSKSTRDSKEFENFQVSPSSLPNTGSRPDAVDTQAPLGNAPVAQDRSLRDVKNLTAQGRTEETSSSREAPPSKKDIPREKEQKPLPSSLKENDGSTFFSGLKSSSTRAADMISKGLFGKSTRSGSTTEKEPAIDDEHYILKVINLPLVEQTRLTRISKRLENSKDKTEFWMPAFPWRAIDYLNYKGCDVEGLYRVPGSGPQIKKWQRKFDEQYDVNLFDETDLYDVNIIGSMLKAWLRQLPDEIFPKEAQDRIARECAGAVDVPQMLVEELSNLPPFNYYLLFAITCHLSLLLAHSDKNKMDFRNLCICFQPCMKIDAFLFKFLVCDWRECWKGCKNEAKYIEEEYLLFDQPPPRGLSSPQRPLQEDGLEEPALSPTDIAKPPTNRGAVHTAGLAKKHQRRLSESNASVRSRNSSISTNLTTHSDQDVVEVVRDLRPLSPIKPLSPIGF